MSIRKHQNYGVYRSIREDVRYGLLELEDEICVYKDDKVAFGYEAYDEPIPRDAELMTVKELLYFISRNQ